MQSRSYRKQREITQNYKYSQIQISSNLYCKINGTIITSKIDKKIKEYIDHSKIQTFLHHNKGYTKNSFTYIDWNIIKSATKMLTLNRRIWLTKFVGGYSATASKMYTRKTWDSPMCPICNLIPKNTKHFRKYQNLFKNFIEFLDEINTHQDIILVFHKTLHQQCHTSFMKTNIILKCDQNILIAAQEQDEFQWHIFFKRHISKKWKIAQHSYLKQIFLILSSIDTWQRQNIFHIYNFFFQMWDHRYSIMMREIT